MYEINS